MAINDSIREEKVQSNINREVAKIWALSSGKIDKYILQVKKYYHLIKVK